MEDYKVRYCRLCFSTIHCENYEVIENDTKDVLRVLASKLDVKHDEEHTCNACSAKLSAVQKFQMTCLYTESTISRYIDDTTTLPLDLKEIYMKERGSKHLSDDVKICRLCMEPIKNVLEFTSINEEQVDVIFKIVPKMDIFVIKEPVMCKVCQDFLVMYYDFLKKCSGMEPNITNIPKGQVPDVSSAAATIDVSVKIENVDVNCGHDIHHSIKTECMDIKYDEIKDESEMHGQELPSSKAVWIKCHSEVQFDKDPSEVKTFKCQNCNYETKYKKVLPEHILTHKDRTEVQLYKCEHCKFVTKYKRYLKQHMLRHTDELQMYKCEHCNFESKYKNCLTKHMLRHRDISEVQMYKCDYCDFQTKDKKYLTKHMLRHRDPSGVQKYKCTSCNYETNDKFYLKKHMLLHKHPSEMQTYKCTICSYVGEHKRLLNNHMLIHKSPSEVQMYKCAICNYETKRKGYLDNHVLKHKNPSEVQMYKCENCDFQSKYKRNLKKHMLLHNSPVV